MRKFKFKAWDKLKKKWIDNFVIGSNGEVMTLKDNCIKETRLVQDSEQKDMHKKEIFETDIVRQRGIMPGVDPEDFIGEIKLLDGTWVIDNGEELRSLFNEGCDNEIIGNELEGCRN